MDPDTLKLIVESAVEQASRRGAWSLAGAGLMTIIAIAGSIFSLLGFVYAKRALAGVDEVRNRLRRKAQLPIYIATLNDHAKRLNSCLSDFEKMKHEADSQIHEIHATTVQLSQIVSSGNKELEELQKRAKQVVDSKSTDLKIDEVRDVYKRVRGVHRSMTLAKEQEEWT